MVITALITGSWFPRTKLHLKEYYAFLKSGTSHLPIDKKLLDETRRTLGPTAVAYHGGRFDRVTSDFGGYSAAYHEDGLLTITSPASGADFAIDVARLRDFYDKTMAPALSELFSIGTPVMSPGVAHDSKRPVIVLLDAATDEEIEGLAASCGDEVHFVARSTERTVHFADNHIFIVGAGDAALEAKLAEEYVFFREYEHKLRHFLDMHRSVWEAIEAMRSKNDLKLGDLPGVRDRLLDYDRDLTVLGARLGQMDAYLDERQSQIDDLGLAKTMMSLEAYRYGKMRIATKYMDRLFEMLDDYISSTVEITGLMYQENLQKEINFQQFIFLLGAVAAVITLGAIVSSKITLYGPDGTMLTSGVIKAFDVNDFFLLGGCAFFATLVIFAVIRPLISSFKRIRVTTLLGDNGARKSKRNDNL